MTTDVYYAGSDRGTRHDNPILKGSHPDPSICRVGQDYYLTVSTFEWSPGCPIYHSRDLVHWRHLGDALTSQDQLPLEGLDNSNGVFAPTLRHHEGRFFLITTIVNPEKPSFRNLIVTATDPAGPWSAPICLPEDVGRIDPSLFFDDDGSIWLTINDLPSVDAPLCGGNREIRLLQLDRESFQPLGASSAIWWGAMQKAVTPEAPHIYKKDGFYYLVIAEGGTGENHAVTIARSESITGPYRGCPGNPILTHRHLGPDTGITCAGHADFVQTHTGKWWAVVLACRPLRSINFLGRETFLVPVEWAEGAWPVINPGVGRVESSFIASLPAPHGDEAISPPPQACAERKLPSGWLAPFNPHIPFWECLDDGFLLDTSPVPPDGKGNPSMLVQRVTEFCFEAQAAFSWDADVAEAGMVLYLNRNNQVRLALRTTSSGLELTVLAVEKATVRVCGRQCISRAGKEAYSCRLKLVSDSMRLSCHFQPGVDARGDARWECLTEGLDIDFMNPIKVAAYMGLMIGIYGFRSEHCLAACCRVTDWSLLLKSPAQTGPAPVTPQ